MFLLDTNVVCELRKGARANPKVRKWAEALPATSLYLSAVSILELEIGIILMQRSNRKEGAALRRWIDNHVLPTFINRILPVDTAVAQRCALLLLRNSRAGRDALIAATALVHSMAVATHDVSHFESMGVTLVDPWQV